MKIKSLQSTIDISRVEIPEFYESFVHLKVETQIQICSQKIS